MKKTALMLLSGWSLAFAISSLSAVLPHTAQAACPDEKKKPSLFCPDEKKKPSLSCPDEKKKPSLSCPDEKKKPSADSF
jgi:hypothetical protein